MNEFSRFQKVFMFFVWGIALLLCFRLMLDFPGPAGSMPLPEWSQFKPDPTVLDQVTKLAENNNFHPSERINDETAAARLSEKFPTAYYAGTEPSKNFGLGQKAVITWIFWIDPETSNFFIYQQYPPNYKTAKSIDPTIQNYTLHFKNEYDWIGVIAAIFMLIFVPIMPVAMAALVFEAFNDGKSKKNTPFHNTPK